MIPTAKTYVTSMVLTVVGVDRVDMVVVFEANTVSFSLRCMRQEKRQSSYQSASRGSDCDGARL